MAKSRQPAPVALTDRQRGRLERLWFVYGNYGSKTTPGNHQFIQCLLEHGIDIRPLQTKRTAKRDTPTAECVAAVESVLSSKEGDGEGVRRPGLRRLVPPTAERRGPVKPDPESKGMLDGVRRRLSANRGRDGFDAGGEDAA
jgi:hypothetical protein